MMKRPPLSTTLLCSLATAFLAGDRAALADQIVVTSTADYRGVSGDCTLFEAIITLHTGSPQDRCTAAREGPSTIILPGGTYVVRTAFLRANGASAFAIGMPIRILGRGATLVRDPAAGSFRFFDVTAHGDLTLEFLTLSGGLAEGAAGDDGTAGRDGEGGAVHNAGVLRLIHATLAGNRALGGAGGEGRTRTAGPGGRARGGAVYNTGLVTAVRTTFANNEARGGVGGHGYSGNFGGSGGDGIGGSLYSGPGAHLEITDSRLLSNRAHGGGGGWGTPALITAAGAAPAAGGAIHALGVASLSGCVLEDNAALGGSGKYPASGHGGAVAVEKATVAVRGSIFKGNRAAGGSGYDFHTGGASGGGGALSTSYGSVELTGTAFVNNVAEGGHGQSSTGVATPGAGAGGGVLATAGSLLATNVTMSGNVAHGSVYSSGGGALHADRRSFVKMVHGTVMANGSDSAGGGLVAAGDAMVLGGTLVTGNVGPAGNCSGLPITDEGHNLQYPGRTCGGSIPEADPRTGPLQLGARTFYHSLLVGSPARDVASLALCPTVDQRSHTRPLDGDGDGVAVCDIGAVEAADPPGLGDLLFQDGFDSGDLLRWPGASTGDGDLAVTPPAALDATAFGLQAIVNDTASLYVEDLSPDREDRYRARFYFDPGDFDPGTAGGHLRARVFLGFGEEPMRRVFALVLRLQDGQYGLMARARTDAGLQVDRGFHPITRGTHLLEVDWRRSSGVDDGWLLLWIDGQAVAQLTSLDNDEDALGFARLGAMGLKPGAGGTLYFDGFEARRETYIGP
jgi:hypothetical protein